MKSRKKLKKEINKVFTVLYRDCIFYEMFVVNADKEAAHTVLEKIVLAENDLITRVGKSEGKLVKGRVKKYFKKLRADVKTKTNEIAADIAALP